MWTGGRREYTEDTLETQAKSSGRRAPAEPTNSHMGGGRCGASRIVRRRCHKHGRTVIVTPSMLTNFIGVADPGTPKLPL